MGAWMIYAPTPLKCFPPTQLYIQEILYFLIAVQNHQKLHSKKGIFPMRVTLINAGILIQFCLVYFAIKATWIVFVLVLVTAMITHTHRLTRKFYFSERQHLFLRCQFEKVWWCTIIIDSYEHCYTFMVVINNGVGVFSCDWRGGQQAGTESSRTSKWRKFLYPTPPYQLLLLPSNFSLQHIYG